MIQRKNFLKMMLTFLVFLNWGASDGFSAPVRGGSLDPTTVPKFVTPLVIPPVMPKTATLFDSRGRNTDYYEIAVREFRQRILPDSFYAGLNGDYALGTKVWSYGSVNHPGTFNYPAFTIEAFYKKPVRVKWINELVVDPITCFYSLTPVPGACNYLSHLLPVDQTLHWANPPGGTLERDSRPVFDETPGPYTGPVPIVVHLHGGHSHQESDGFPEAWYLPAADNIPDDFANFGSFYEHFKNISPLGNQWGTGFAVFEYDNIQRATTLWFHDHTLGMTRTNVYAGPAGFYLLRGGPADLKLGFRAPKEHDNPRRAGIHTEIPVVIQDRSFNDDGSLFYPDTREFFDDFEGPFIPDSDVPPIWNPEFFGNHMVVNGKTWPFLNVEQRRYRFRFLNGCNSRFLILQMDNGLPFWVLGTEGGFLPPAVGPLSLDQLLLGPAERFDVIVDFADVPVGTQIILQNLGPDEPFGGGEPEEDFSVSDPETTGQVMRFVVGPRTKADDSADPATLVLPPLAAIGPATYTRQVSLNEEESAISDGPIAALLGTLDGAGRPVPKMWADSITENPALNAIEVWEIYNFTEDAHPIHIHEVMFEVEERQPFGGVARDPEVWETGQKDTVIAYPGEITRVKALYDRPGLLVWHCHILEHEDNEMMRPYCVGMPGVDCPSELFAPMAPMP